MSPSSLMQELIRKASSFSRLTHSALFLSASARPPVINSIRRKPGVEAGITKAPSSLIISELESFSTMMR